MNSVTFSSAQHNDSIRCTFFLLIIFSWLKMRAISDFRLQKQAPIEIARTNMDNIARRSNIWAWWSGKVKLCCIIPS